MQKGAEADQQEPVGQGGAAVQLPGTIPRPAIWPHTTSIHPLTLPASVKSSLPKPLQQAEEAGAGQAGRLGCSKQASMQVLVAGRLAGSGGSVGQWQGEKWQAGRH